MSTLNATLKRPSAFLPIAMSFVALALVIGYIALFGIVHETDEGATAHIWQLLMVIQVPIIAFFAIKYVPQNPRQAILVIWLQIAAALIACAPVFIFKL